MKRITVISLFLMLCTYAANAANVTVNCNLPGQNGKINNALKFLNPAGPNTITVIGTCKENVVIQSFDRLTLVAKSGAVITDASGGQQWADILINDSRRISIQGFTISGGNVGVSCNDYSLCRFSGNTITGTTQRGVDINASNATFWGDFIQNNAGLGIYAQGSNISGASNLTIRNNAGGVFVQWSTVVGDGWNVSNNTQDGIQVGMSYFQLVASSVYANGYNGINVGDLSSINFAEDTVTGNGYDGVYIGNTTIASFNGGSFTGNGYVWGAPDIGCGGQYAIAEGIAGIYGTTDCPVQQSAKTQVRVK